MGKPLEANLSVGWPVATAQPAVFNVTKSGLPSASQVLLTFFAVVNFRLPQNLTGSYAKATVAATALSTFTIKKNGASVGTFQFAAAATVATFTFAANVDFTTTTPDELTVEAPASPDATLANVTFALLGSRL